MKLNELDNWQKEVVELIRQGNINICVKSGRQVGKSTAIAVGVGEYALISQQKGDILVISHTEKQAYLLFSKIRDYILDNHKRFIKKPFSRNITKSEINLINKKTIRCLPCGLDGTTIRGYTACMVVADEAAHIPTPVFDALTPVLATTGGAIVLLSTPKGIGNYFYDSYHNPSFKTFHISSEDCPRIPKEFLEEQKRTKTKLVYAQEYLGEFTDNLRQLFPDKLIKDCMTSKRCDISPKYAYFLGVDVARMGGDECTFEIVRKIENDRFEHVENYVTENILIPDTINRILELETQYKFKKIYIDTGGMGVAVFDFLLRKDQTRRKVVAINNAQRPIERDKMMGKRGRRRELMKEHLYMNLKRMMEQGYIKLLGDENIFFSLKSVQCEVTETGDIKIFGNYTHIAEGLIRAAWSSQEKNLNLWITAV